VNIESTLPLPFISIFLGWERREYIMLLSAFLSFLAICFSVRSSNKSAQISIRSQILSISDKISADLPDSLQTSVGYLHLYYCHHKITSFYSKMVTFVQILDGSGLNRKHRNSIKELLWLQTSPTYWDEVSKGEGYSEILGHLSKDAQNTVSNHRALVCKSFKAVIKKHKGRNFPINVPKKVTSK